MLWQLLKRNNSNYQILGKYSSRSMAFEAVKNYVIPVRVMLGDDMKFWIVTPATAATMERDGYEYAR